MLDDGRPYTVQYFERNRFEYHPEYARTKNEVLLGRLGAGLLAAAEEQVRTWPVVTTPKYGAAPAPPPPSLRDASRTGTRPR